MPLDNRPIFLTLAGVMPVRNVMVMPDAISVIERADPQFHTVRDATGTVTFTPPPGAQTRIDMRGGGTLFVAEPLDNILSRLGGLAGS